MTKSSADVSQRKAALVAGVGAIILLVAAIIAEFLSRQRLVVPGDAAATVNNIMTSQMLFRSGIGGYLIILIFDVVLAWAFYVFFRQVNRSLSVLAAWFRLVYTAVFGAALFSLIAVLPLLSGAEYLTVFETDQLHAQVMLSLNAFSDGWAVAYIFFGPHLFFLGYLVLKSGYVPRVLGIWLISAAVYYIVDTCGNLLLPNYEAYAGISLVVGFATGFSELGFALWLLFKGGKTPQMKS